MASHPALLPSWYPTPSVDRFSRAFAIASSTKATAFRLQTACCRGRGWCRRGCAQPFAGDLRVDAREDMAGVRVAEIVEALAGQGGLDDPQAPFFADRVGIVGASVQADGQPGPLTHA